MDAKTLGTTGRIRFDVTQEHRLAGNGATYIVENYRKAIEHPEFQQAIKMGNAFGYHGHPRRKVLKDGKMIFEPILFPHESEAMPTHVCRFAEMDGKYCTHEQEFIDHEKGKEIFGMWKGKTGGFSSRASTIGGYGGRFYPTKLAKMAGFDFVHDRSYRYNSFEGILATESTIHPMELEYLIDDLGVNEKAAHFICNGGVCPNPKDMALEQAIFMQVMEHEIALEESHRNEIDAARNDGVKLGFKNGFEENLDNERKAFRDEIEEFQETFKENRENDLIAAERIAIECVQRMPRKPHLPDGFYRTVAPSLIKNGTDQVSIESTFYEIVKPFTGYTPADFTEPEEEYVNASQPKRRSVFYNQKDSFLIPH